MLAVRVRLAKVASFGERVIDAFPMPGSPWAQAPRCEQPSQFERALRTRLEV
jgi:hypothetical protein